MSLEVVPLDAHPLHSVSMALRSIGPLCCGCGEQVLVTDINTSLRRLVDDINEDNWMYNPVDVGYSTGQQSR